MIKRIQYVDSYRILVATDNKTPFLSGLPDEEFDVSYLEPLILLENDKGYKQIYQTDYHGFQKIRNIMKRRPVYPKGYYTNREDTPGSDIMTLIYEDITEDEGQAILNHIHKSPLWFIPIRLTL